MIIQRLARRSCARRAPISNLRTAQPRRIHHVPPLTHDAAFKEQGVAGVLSPEGFDIAWTQYQTVMVDKLNRLTAGTPDENATTKTLLLNSARQADKASLFNHASMAHNNHFFFNCLSPKPTSMPPTLSNQLAQDFSSVETLRREFIATTAAMFGPGFVWLVKLTDQAQFRILPTYLAGTPYPGAHQRRQPVDLATQSDYAPAGPDPSSLSAADHARQTTVQNSVGAFGPGSAQQPRMLAPGGVGLTPVLCINTWEHVWLRDWGVAGKKAYLEKWWDMVDWRVVASNASVGGSRRGYRG